jgi:hypothetical protein
MYCVKSNNVHNQLLLFISKEEAKEWLKAATRLTEDEIEKAIIEVKQIIPGMYSIYPTH